MKLAEYQHLASRTLNAAMPHREQLSMAALGLSGEAGEAVELIKKALYHGHDLPIERLRGELGDVLFYIAALATVLGVSLEDVARGNIDKLQARYPHGFSSEASQARADERPTYQAPGKGDW